MPGKRLRVFRIIRFLKLSGPKGGEWESNKGSYGAGSPNLYQCPDVVSNWTKKVGEDRAGFWDEDTVNAHIIWDWKLYGKHLRARPRCTWQQNTTKGFREVDVYMRILIGINWPRAASLRTSDLPVSAGSCLDNAGLKLATDVFFWILSNS
jgi:hypothetical protein